MSLEVSQVEKSRSPVEARASISILRDLEQLAIAESDDADLQNFLQDPTQKNRLLGVLEDAWKTIAPYTFSHSKERSLMEKNLELIEKLKKEPNTWTHETLKAMQADLGYLNRQLNWDKIPNGDPYQNYMAELGVAPWKEFLGYQDPRFLLTTPNRPRSDHLEAYLKLKGLAEQKKEPAMQDFFKKSSKLDLMALIALVSNRLWSSVGGAKANVLSTTAAELGDKLRSFVGVASSQDKKNRDRMSELAEKALSFYRATYSANSNDRVEAHGWPMEKFVEAYETLEELRKLLGKGPDCWTD